jgi:hypothetical protein
MYLLNICFSVSIYRQNTTSYVPTQKLHLKMCTLDHIIAVFWFLHRRAVKFACVAEEHIASIFRVTIRSSSFDLILSNWAEIQKIICSRTAVKS